MEQVTQQVVRDLFDYHPDGYLVNRSDRGRTAKKGERVGRGKTANYRQVRVFGKPYREHRLIWLWHYGGWPKNIDHIDHDKLNNKIENLRDVDHKTNIRHGSGRQAGITFSKRLNKFLSAIYVDCKRIHLGCFATYEEALEARKKAEKEMWWGL